PEEAGRGTGRIQQHPDPVGSVGHIAGQPQDFRQNCQGDDRPIAGQSIDHAREESARDPDDKLLRTPVHRIRVTWVPDRSTGTTRSVRRWWIWDEESKPTYCRPPLSALPATGQSPPRGAVSFPPGYPPLRMPDGECPRPACR